MMERRMWIIEGWVDRSIVEAANEINDQATNRNQENIKVDRIANRKVTRLQIKTIHQVKPWRNVKKG
jgi:hypothetical protein